MAAVNAEGQEARSTAATNRRVIATANIGSYADNFKKAKTEPQLNELGQAVQGVRCTAIRF